MIDNFVVLIIMIITIIIIIVKTVKTNDKIRRFGVVMTPLSRKILNCKLQTLSNMARKLIIIMVITITPF